LQDADASILLHQSRQSDNRLPRHEAVGVENEQMLEVFSPLRTKGL
jgi:hypothetical protein